MIQRERHGRRHSHPPARCRRPRLAFGLDRLGLGQDLRRVFEAYRGTG
jgi:hypothetical protein